MTKRTGTRAGRRIGRSAALIATVALLGWVAVIRWPHTNPHADGEQLQPASEIADPGDPDALPPAPAAEAPTQPGPDTSQRLVAMLADQPAIALLSPGTLVTFLPKRLGRMSLIRSENEVMATSIAPVARARGFYASDDAELTLEISDLGNARNVLAFAGWSLMEDVDHSGPEGHERVYRRDSRRYYQQWDTVERSGVQSILAGDRILVTCSGPADDATELEAVLAAIDLDGLSQLVTPAGDPQAEVDR